MGRVNVRTLVTSVILAAVFVAPMVAATGVVAGSNHAPSIESGAFVEDGVLGTADDNVTTMWNDGNYTLRLRVDAPSDSYRVCSRAPDATDGDCRHVRLENGTNTVNVTTFPWEKNDTGRHNVTVLIRDSGTPEIHDSITMGVELLDPAGDLDGDGLDNRAEVRWGTNMTVSDTDGDGLEDGNEVTVYGTNPLTNDTDGDGLPDAREVNGQTDPNDSDTDGDGLEDGPEVNEYDTDPLDPDTDDDGLEDGPEVNEYDTDPTDEDTDDDGYDDGREVKELGTDPNDASVPTESTDDAWTGFPNSIGNSVYVLGAVALLGVGIAIGVSVLRNEPLRRRLFGGETDESEDGEGAPPIGPARPPDGGASEAAGSPDANDEASRRSAVDERPSPAPILTDEERVLRILHDHDGQVKQQRIVHDTDWSKSKVSRLLSRMADENKIRKITLGRENVIRLPEEGTEPDGPTDTAGWNGE